MLGLQMAKKLGLSMPTDTLMTSVKTEVATTPHKKRSSNLKIVQLTSTIMFLEINFDQA